MAAGTLELLGEKQLPAQIVAQHPILPEGVGGVGPQREFGEQAAAANGRIGRRGIKDCPAVALEMRLDPTVGVRGANHVLPGEWVERSALKSIDQPCWNAD